MALSKKHYEAVAAIVKIEYGNYASGLEDFAAGARHGSSGVAVRLADYFAEDNARFDRDRFLKACGVAD